MECPRCGKQMSQGSPHADDAVSQWECYGPGGCGYIESVYPSTDEE